MRESLLALSSIALSVAAQFVLKNGVEAAKSLAHARHEPLRLFGLMLDWRVCAGLSLYGIGALLWLGVLSNWDVSKAYPLVGLGFVLTAIIGAMSGESISQQRIVGIALIACGVFVTSRS